MICLLCAAQLEISNVVSLKQDERIQRAEEHPENTEFQEEIQTEPLNYYDEDYTLDCDTADEGDDFDVDGGDDEESDPDFKGDDGSDSGMWWSFILKEIYIQIITDGQKNIFE